MRLNTREKNLLALLCKQPATGKELAEKLGVSRRTILRDVRHINEVLQCAHAGFISANSNYTLRVDSHVALEELVQDGCDETTEVLIALLCLPHPTVALIAEKTLLSQARIRKAILAINEHYRALCACIRAVVMALSWSLSVSARQICWPRIWCSRRQRIRSCDTMHSTPR